MGLKAEMMLRTGNRGFTLIEIMVATAVLSLGTVFIYEAFFSSLDAFNYCSNYLNVASWMDEKVWQAQEALGRFGPQAKIQTAGMFTSNNKDFKWSLSNRLIDKKEGLYRIDLALSWQEGSRKRKLTRAAYALYEEEA